MNTQPSAPRRSSTRVLSRGDVVAMWVFIIAGVALFVGTVYTAANRVVRALAGDTTEVEAVFAGTKATAPIGVDRAPTEVRLERAWLTPDALSPAGTGALVLQNLCLVAATGIVVVSLLLVTLSVMRGTVFGRRNTRLVITAGVAAISGMFGVPFFGNMVANDAFRDISEGTFDNVIMSVDLGPLVLAAFVFAMAATVFTVGSRLEHETEGLV